MSGQRTSQGNTTPSRVRGLPFHWSYLLLLAFLVFFSWKYLEKTREVQGLARQEAALRYANLQVQNANSSTQREITHARTMQYVEDTARSMLGYTMPGETSVQLTAKLQRAPVFRQAPPRPTAPPLPTWQQWWNSFFG